MKKIKIISAICAAVMLISAVSGCAAKDNGETSGAGTSSEEELSKTPGSSEPTETSMPFERPDITLTRTLSNPNADENARKVYEYLCDIFGMYILSCQQESTWMGSPEYEMEIIETTTGKLPAMRGLDFMNDDFDGVVERSKAWHEKGGLVTICWHTGINGLGYQESLDDVPDFEKLLTPGTDEYNAMI